MNTCRLGRGRDGEKEEDSSVIAKKSNCPSHKNVFCYYDFHFVTHRDLTFWNVKVSVHS